jgi:PAS domain S-box-containing protein
MYLAGEAREVTFVSGSFDKTYPHLVFDFSVPVAEAREALAGELLHEAVVVGWSVPEADAIPLIGYIRERQPNLAIVSIGERSSDSAREAGADEYVQRGASMLTRLPMVIEESVRKRADLPAGPAPTGTPDASVEALAADVRFEVQPEASPISATEAFPLESAGGEPLGVMPGDATPAATIRIGFAGDVEQARVLASIDASIEIVPIADVATTVAEGSACAAVVVDQGHASLDVLQTLNEVRALSLPAILLYDPAAANAAFRAFAGDADEFVANDGDWMRQVKERIELAAERSRRHRDLAAVKAREARLRATIDTLPAAVVRLSAEGSILAANRVATSLLGATESRQLLRKQFYSFVSAPDRDQCNETVTLVCGGESRSIDVWATTLGGESRAIQINAVPVAGDSGSPGAVLAVIRDVTDHKRLEVSLEQALARTGTIAEPTPAVASLPDTAAATRDHEPEIAAVVERAVPPTLDLDSIRALESQLHQVSREARQSFELLETSLRDAETHHETVAARHREEQAAFEAAQSERWRSYDAFVRSAAHPILHTTTDGTLASVNPAFVTLLGDASAEALLARGASLEALTPIEDWRAAVELWREADGTAPLETRWKRQDGTTLLLLMHGRRITGRTAADERIEIIAENVTARRALERQLKRAQRWEDVAKVTTGLAADLQQAVRSLNASAELAVDTSSPAMLADLRQQAAHAETLSRQLVAFGRREARQPAQLDLNDMVRDLESLLRRVADEHVELTLELARQVDTAQADRAVIGEALIGLTMAAASALPAGGRIQVSTTARDVASRNEAPDGVAPGAYAVLKVTASGWGLASAEVHSASGPIAPIRHAVERAGGTLVVVTTPESSLEFSVYLALVAELVEI